MATIKNVGDGRVVLIAGGGKVYTDIAARFVRSERSVDDIIASEYDSNIVKNILESGHLAATEFDYFIFGVEGYSRVTETQLVRKRMASYLIKSGRQELDGKRAFNVVLPKSVAEHKLPGNSMTGYDLVEILEAFYESGRMAGLPEEDLRYFKPQATEFKAIIGMNAHALLDWFSIRCCLNAQAEIRDMATKMLHLCKQAAPDLFAKAGPNCVKLGYCPENRLQNKRCKKRGVLTHEEVKVLIERQMLINDNIVLLTK